MPISQFTGGIRNGASPQEIVDYIIRLERKLDFLLQKGLDTDNVREISGWRASPDQLASKDGDVGMSTTDTAGDDIRFWAGDVITGTPSFYVTKSGKMFAGNGEFVGKITADEGEIGGFTITATALTATAGGTIQNQTAAGDKVYINNTGFHANDAAGVERLSISTTPSRGAKALIGRDSTGTEQSIYTYNTETVDGASRTGQFITAHGAYAFMGNDGFLRMQDVNSRGFRTQASGNPEINDGFGWSKIAKRSESGYSLTTGVNTVNLLDRDGNTLSTVTLNINKTTSSHTQPDHNHGIPDGTVLMVDGGGTVTFVASGGFSHSHTVT